MTRLIEKGLISVGNLAWLNENGYIDDSGHINFSDRFDAIMSNTNPNYGNTLKAPADAKHKYGLIPEKMLPWTDNQTNYFNRSLITQEMYNMGLEFLKRFKINYEMVYPSQYKDALKVSPLASACYAWNGTNNGVYFRVENTINHAICVIDPPDIWHIMDSYEPFIKGLANNYSFSGHAIRYVITEVPDANPSTVKKNMYILKRDPQNVNEVYAFTEDKIAKRHIANKQTLVNGAKSPDKYWAWSESTPIPEATVSEFTTAIECPEILLLDIDSKYVETDTGSKFNLWAWIKKLFS
ncbi:MAG: hypothetical protein H7831_09900 [Magnetococcus sp. WYHC-3]